MAPHPRPALNRFTEKYREAADGCWVWTAGKSTLGYGRFHVGSRTDGTARTVQAHRWSYEHFVGPIPDSLTIDHLCRNRACVNPAHLEPVTDAENIRRGEAPPAQNARRDTCKHGHPFAGENLVVLPDGRRQCRECLRRRGREHRETPKRQAQNRRYAQSAKRKAYKRGYDIANRERHAAYMREWRRKRKSA